VEMREIVHLSSLTWRVRSDRPYGWNEYCFEV